MDPFFDSIPIQVPADDPCYDVTLGLVEVSLVLSWIIFLILLSRVDTKWKKIPNQASLGFYLFLASIPILGLVEIFLDPA